MGDIRPDATMERGSTGGVILNKSLDQTSEPFPQCFPPTDEEVGEEKEGVY